MVNLRNLKMVDSGNDAMIFRVTNDMMMICDGLMFCDDDDDDVRRDDVSVPLEGEIAW